MPKLPGSILLLALLFILSSCNRDSITEKADVAYWNSNFIDSSYRLLYQYKDTVAALKVYDSSLQQLGEGTVYAKASRYGLLANYYYFFTPDNAATARMVDSALSQFNTPELQHTYPRTYVSYLLFGGQIAYRLLQYTKANDYYFEAKKIADAHLNPCERTAFNYSIAMVLYKQQNYKQSTHYFKEAYALQSRCSPQTTSIVLQQQEIQSNIGLCLVQLKLYDSALVYFDKALQIADRYKDSLGAVSMDKVYGVVYGNKAQVSFAKNRLKEAEKFCLQSIKLNDREGYERENAMGVKLLLADIYSRQKDLALMQNVLNSVGKNIERQTSPALQLEWRRLQAFYYEQSSQYQSGLDIFKSYIALRDSISKVQKALTEADVNRQLYEKEQEMQIAVLKSDKQLAVISLWVTIIFSGMAMAIIVLIYHNYRRSKKNLAVSLALNEEIKLQKAAREEEAKQRHQQITKAVIQAQEVERSLIGLELHDNINQVLTTVKLYNEMVLEGIGDPKIVLPRASGYLQNCINEIRGLSKRLSAPTLGKISLEESVNDLLDSVNSTSKVKITKHISGLENKVLKKELHIGVYRILQEQINNVMKHAEASEVVVQLEARSNMLHLRVSDNGKGFEVRERKEGIGLINMRTRAENLNGSFEIKSQPGDGCQLVVILPA